MTDNEIIKALECCIGGYGVRNCDDCSMHGKAGCIEVLPEFALDLIERQKSEIEKLKEENSSIRYCYETAKSYNESIAKNCGEMCKSKAKSEAIKEFSERLENALNNCETIGDRDNIAYITSDVHDIVNDLVKVMTEVK